jgi:Ni/Fe-hydrogenase subunit HybB-like protein
MSAISHEGYASREPVKSVPWHRLVVWDMLANSMTTGLFLVAVLCEFMAPEEFGPISRLAYPVALVFLTIDLVLLTLDLGDPWRFHHMLRVFKPSSPMSLGVWSLTAYSFPLGVAAVFGFLPEGPVVEAIRRTALVLGIVPAFASAVYKGVLLSTSAQPGWRDARWLGANHTTTALTLGAAQMIGLALALGRFEAASSLRWMLAVLLAIQFVTSLLLMAEMWPAATRGHGPSFRGLAIGALLGGTVAPLGLAFVPGTAALATASALVLLGTFTSRWLLVRLPHAAQR